MSGAAEPAEGMAASEGAAVVATATALRPKRSIVELCMLVRSSVCVCPPQPKWLWAVSCVCVLCSPAGWWARPTNTLLFLFLDSTPDTNPEAGAFPI